jgi:hypothetical protein
MTLATPIYHGGMLTMTKQMYIGVLIGIVVLQTWCAPNGVFTNESGYNWVNASLMYIIAGFFAVHGWHLRPFMTWLLFAAIFRFEWYTVDYDVCALVPPKWQWTLITLRHRQIPLKPRTPLGWTPAGIVIYICPLSFFWGVVALYAFKTVSLPTGISRGVTCLSVKGFMIHYFDFMPIFSRQRNGWHRISERSPIPLLTWKSMVLVTTQLATLGFFLEVYRERLFSVAYDVGMRVWEARPRFDEEEPEMSKQQE